MNRIIFGVVFALGFFSANQSKAILSYSVQCNGFSLGILSFCTSYTWTAVCAGGCGVSGNEEYSSDCASAANSACSGCGGLVTADSCSPGLILVNGVCVQEVIIPVSRLSLSKDLEKKATASAGVSDQYCANWKRVSCEGKCVEPSTPCDGKCSKGMILSDDGKACEAY